MALLRFTDLAHVSTAGNPGAAPGSEFDDLARIAAVIGRTPDGAVTVLDADSRPASSPADTAPRPAAAPPPHHRLCAATLASPTGPLVLADAALSDVPEIGHYAGVIIGHRGRAIGVVSAFGPGSREAQAGEIEALVALARLAGDQLELRRRTEEWRDLAGTDPLTGVANRRRLLEAMEVALAERRMGEDRTGVLFCDIDALKAVNDTFGHEAGDRLLCEVARRLRHAVRDTDVVARISGDEFVVLCPRLSGPPALELTTHRVRELAAAPWDGPAGALRLSVGAVLAEAGEAPDAVLRRADAMMYAEKAVRRASPRA